MNRKNLQRYLNDHLAGSAGAVDLIQSIADAHDDPEAKSFFLDLRGKVEHDRGILKSLIAKLGESDSSLLQTAGTLTAKASKLKLWWEGFEPGELGLFEGMEMLVLGIQGKRVLWTMLGEIAPGIAEWEGVNFADLELEAIAQRDAVEVHRLKAGKEALLHQR